MKLMRLSILIVLSIIILSSCSKEEDDLISQDCNTDCTEIIGRIMTDNGTVPIPNLELTVTWDSRSGLNGGTIRTKAITETDANGNYSLSFLIRDDELLDGVFQISYDEIDEDIYATDNLNRIVIFEIDRNTTLLVNHNIPQKAFLNLTLLNLDNIQQGDSFSTNFSYESIPGFSQPINGSVRAWSNESNNDNIIILPGNQQVELEIIRRVNNVTTRENDIIMIDSGSTLDYTIDYNN